MMDDLLDDPRIEQYLDAVTAPFVGVVMPKRVATIRDEIRAHLTAIVSEEESAGKSHADAVDSALARFGDAKTVGRRLLKASGFTMLSEAIHRPLRFLLSRAAFGLFLIGAWLLIMKYITYSVQWHGNVALAAVAGVALAGSFIAVISFAVPWLDTAKFAIQHAINPQRSTIEMGLPRSMVEFLRLPEPRASADLHRAWPAIFAPDGSVKISRSSLRQGRIVGAATAFFPLLLTLFINVYDYVTERASVGSHANLVSNTMYAGLLQVCLTIYVAYIGLQSMRHSDQALESALARLPARYGADGGTRT